MHSRRTFAVDGEKQVHCLVESVAAITHSYTIHTLISSEGKLFSPLFLVLKEQSGKFRPVVEANRFRAENVHIEASKSGKLTSDHFKIWLEKIYFPNVGPNSVLLIDAWSGHCPRTVAKTAPENRHINVQRIPTGTTNYLHRVRKFVQTFLVQKWVHC
ncbi:uncharacterized protein LOC117177031 [Belonocnema kinseyi]|uniref:uncharacterized protein LOC117177031 n=1 Tax=Belonocnema kinseyi TaxID=2817044 RepID=UPI00143D4BF6|nr:uncharacterized protein LOC117177031 [Belonocnema kinseyi]